MKQTFKSLISQLISASVFSEKWKISGIHLETVRKDKNGASPAETGRVGRSVLCYRRGVE